MQPLQTFSLRGVKCGLELERCTQLEDSSCKTQASSSCRQRLQIVDLVTSVGFKNTPTREMPGTVSFNSSS